MKARMSGWKVWGRSQGSQSGILGVVPILLLGFGLLAVGLGISTGAQANRTTVLTGVRHWSADDNTRIVLETSQPVNFRESIDPIRRIYRLTLSQSVISPNLNAITLVRDGLVKDVRLAEVPNGLEIAVYLDELREIKPFTLPADRNQNFRIVIDIPRNGLPPPARAEAPAPPPVRPVLPVRRSASGYRERIVIIDPGHGGEATGAVGYRRTKEKTICLAIARKLVDQLNGQPGVAALLTRTADYDVPLRDRYRFADSCRADVFVSIHTNSSRRRTSKGTEVFFLTLGSASDEQTRLLADIENAAEMVEGGSIFEEDVTGILFDLKQKDVLKQSEILAESILNHLTEDRRLSSRGVKQAPFAVLKSPITPSVLVETAFINNPKEAKLLRDGKFQDHLAEQIGQGILEFLALSPSVQRDIAAQEFLDNALAKQNSD